VFEQLQIEVLRIVERVKEKNEIIQAMKVKIEDQKSTEERLKKEIKRAVRKTPATSRSLDGNKTRDQGFDPVHSPRKGQSPQETIDTAISPSSPLPRSPIQPMGRRASVDSPLVKQASSPILRLAPSRREISRSRVSELLSPSTSVKSKILPKSNPLE
jgi:hypothetical protein